MEYITSDLHFGHKNILEFCSDTRPFDDIRHMNDELIKQWNRTVGENDTIYHLGDFCFKGQDFTDNTLKQLNGNKVFILGNHDKHTKDVLSKHGQVYDYLYLKRKNASNVVMFHYPILQWDGKERGVPHLYGHCVDMDTEILTKEGFKTREELSKDDVIGTFNPETFEFEWNVLQKIHDIQYSGDVYTISNRSVSQRVTREHRVPYKTESGNYRVSLSYELYSNSESRVNIINGCNNNNSFIDINNEMLKLYVCLVTDGSVKQETNLCRIRVKKEKKVKYIRELLDSLSIDYKTYQQNDDGVSFNFYLPEELHRFNIKGMDNFLLDCSEPQFKAILDAIANTDGMYHGENSVMYFTSKKTEMDIIQTCALKNGYICNNYTREGHGFSNKESYQLYIKQNNGVSGIPKKKIKKEHVDNEKFWCVTVNNGNFFIRRNGKISLTGNCHGTCYRDERCIDVGYDANESRILTLDEAVNLAKQKNRGEPRRSTNDTTF